MCDACEVLKDEVAYLRAQNKELLETITSQLKPAPIVVEQSDGKAFKPLNINGRFTRVRAELEKRSREEFIRQNSKSIAKPDVAQTITGVNVGSDSVTVQTTKQLEEELGVS